MALPASRPSVLSHAASAITTNSLKRKRSDVKRSISEAGLGPSASPPTIPQEHPPKRTKVLIDLSANQYHDAPPPSDDKPYLLVREQVRRALLRENRGLDGTDPKAQLIALFTIHVADEYAPSEQLLLKHVDALASMANLLVQNPSVVAAVMNVKWMGRGEDFVQSYIRLLGNLAATGGSFQNAVLSSLIERFTQTRSLAGRLPNHDIVSRNQLLSRLHQAIRHVLHVAPSSIAIFQSLIKSCFPYSTDSLRTHTDYVSNLFRTFDYEPSLKGEILGLIIDKLMKIDAQVQGDVEEVEEDLGMNLLEDVLTSLEKSAGRQPNDEDSSDSESDEDSEWGEDEDPAVKRLKEIKSSIGKMDAILEMLFEHFTPIFAKRASAEAEAAFDQLSSLFFQTILHTRNSRHTQFLLFHFAQTDPRLLERFITNLITYTFNQRRPHMLRENAAMYLASFISRGSRANFELIDDVIGILLDELERHRQLYEPNCRDGPDLARWPTYYFIAQALLYIFCFRWRSLIVDGDELDDQDIMSGIDFTWRPDLKEIMTRNIHSPLNPLKVCTPPIVQQFARIAYHLRFIYAFTIIEQNKRRPFLASRIVDPLGGPAASGVYQLEAWFPFDPYHLPKSKRWLEGDYVPYQNPPGLVNEGEEEDDTDRSGILDHLDEVEVDGDVESESDED